MILEKKSHQYLLLIVAGAAVFMDYLDTSIVSIALPAITNYLHVGSSISAWIMTGYLLALASMLLVFGKLADRSGKYREIFILGFVIFTVASALCGLSTNITMLIICRILQGTAAAMMVGTATMLVMLHLPEEKKGMAAGVLATMGAAALALGPGLGGVISEYLSWHWIFFINIPVGILGVICALVVIPKSKSNSLEKKPFDILGTIILTLALAIFLAGLEVGNSEGWNITTVLMLLAAPILGVIFLRHELKQADPVVPVKILRNKVVILASVSCLFITIVYLGTIYILPFYLTGPLELGSALAGAVMLTPPIVMMLTGIPAGTLTNSLGCKRLCNISAIFGFISSVMLAASIIFKILPLLIIGLVSLGLALGINEGPTIRRITTHCPEENQGSAGSLIYTVMNIGSVLGIALYSSVASTASGAADIYFSSGIAAACIFGAFMAFLSYITSKIAKDKHTK